MWRLANDMEPVSRQAPKKEEPDADQPTFTEITLDVPGDEGRASGFATRF
jgi:twitching motility protein PilU